MRVTRKLPRVVVEPAELPLVAAVVWTSGTAARAYMVTHGRYFRDATTANDGSIGQFSTLVQILEAAAGHWLAGDRTLSHGPLPSHLLAVDRRRDRLGPAIRASGSGSSGAPGSSCSLRATTVPRWPFPWRGLSVAVLIVVFVVFHLFRAFYRGSGGASVYRADPMSQLATAAGELASQRPGDAVATGLQETFSRFSDIASLATITGRCRDVLSIHTTRRRQHGRGRRPSCRAS